MKILVPFAPPASIPASALVTSTGPSSHHRSNNRGGRTHNRSQQSWTLPTTQLGQYRLASPLLSPRHPAPSLQLEQSLYLGRCQICDITRNSTQQCSSLSTSTLTSLPPTLARAPRPTFIAPNAYTAVHYPNSGNSLDWVIDSGSSHRVTTDLASLTLHESYTTSDNVIISDGTSLSIGNIGPFTLPSLPTPLLFTNVLYVPAM